MILCGDQQVCFAVNNEAPFHLHLPLHSLFGCRGDCRPNSTIDHGYYYPQVAFTAVTQIKNHWITHSKGLFCCYQILTRTEMLILVSYGEDW
jgi:hypothetical protein